ncbi:unnamed protein product [Diamesa hyperborea]
MKSTFMSMLFLVVLVFLLASINGEEEVSLSCSGLGECMDYCAETIRLAQDQCAENQYCFAVSGLTTRVCEKVQHVTNFKCMELKECLNMTLPVPLRTYDCTGGDDVVCCLWDVAGDD